MKQTEQVSDEVIIWRYLSFHRFKDLVEKEHLWFARVDQFDDFLEAFFTEKDYLIDADNMENQGAKYFAGLMPGFTTSGARNEWFVSCWAEYDRESSLLWRAYGRPNNDQNNDFKVAIKTTVGQIRNAIERDLDIRRVAYRDSSKEAIIESQTELKHGDVVFNKKVEYSEEREIRIAYPHDDVNKAMMDDLSQNPVMSLTSDIGEKVSLFKGTPAPETPTGESVPVNISMILSDIYIEHVPISDKEKLHKDSGYLRQLNRQNEERGNLVFNILKAKGLEQKLHLSLIL